MKRLTATFAALVLAVAVAAPSALAAKSVGAKPSHKRIGQKALVHPGKKIAKKAVAARVSQKSPAKFAAKKSPAKLAAKKSPAKKSIDYRLAKKLSVSF